MQRNRENDYKPFALPPEGHGTFLITKAETSPKVNPHILTVEFVDAEGRKPAKTSYDQDKKFGDKGHIQRFYMNKLIDAALGDDTEQFSAADLVNKFVVLDIVHNVVQKKDRDTGELMFKADGTTPDTMTFANVRDIVGPGEPFAEKSDEAVDPLADMAEDD